MAAVDLQVVVGRAPAEVCRALLDLAERPAIDPTITLIEPPAGSTFPHGAAPEGTVFGGTGTLSGSEERFEGSVTAVSWNESVGFGFAYSSGARLLEEWRLTAVPSGTLVRYHAEMALPGGLLGRLLDAVMVGPGFKRQREVMLAHARRALETVHG
jgi:hypothetical protein